MNRNQRIAALLCVALLGAFAAMAYGADKKEKKLDVFWTHPDIASHPLRSIALMPLATFDGNLKAEKEVEIAWGPVARQIGYRWYYSTMSKDLLRRAFGGDSVLSAMRTQILKEGRVDSLAARRLCAALHTSAVLIMRADLWEQVQMEWNQTGKPWTRVQLKAALVDSAGSLLWTASGTETAEGPMHNADSGTLGVKSSGLTTENVTGQGGAPSFQEALVPLLTRWAPSFPPPQAAPPPAATPGTAPTPGGGR
ncbi:MAG TPA: hypothetical protein VJY35_10140 [Candidatus Eisenbacteria bacterium]|nr:hypothetical protein [Candidatus Eisenbacteria bacterium]